MSKLRLLHRCLNPVQFQWMLKRNRWWMTMCSHLQMIILQVLGKGDNSFCHFVDIIYLFEVIAYFTVQDDWPCNAISWITGCCCQINRGADWAQVPTHLSSYWLCFLSQWSQFTSDDGGWFLMLMSLERPNWMMIVNYLLDLHHQLWFLKQNQLMMQNVLKRYLIPVVINQDFFLSSNIKIKYLDLMIDIWYIGFPLIRLDFIWGTWEITSSIWIPSAKLNNLSSEFDKPLTFDVFELLG